MFIRRQDVIDSLATNFRETPDGQVLFQPRKAKVGLPIAWEEYEAVMAALERRQMIDMALTWAALLAAGAYGGYHVLNEGRYLPFFVALGLATIWVFCLGLRNHLAILKPLMDRRADLVRTIDLEAASKFRPD